MRGHHHMDPEQLPRDLPFPAESTVDQMALLALPPLFEAAAPAAEGRAPVTAARSGACAGACADHTEGPGRRPGLPMWSRLRLEELTDLLPPVRSLASRASNRICCCYSHPLADGGPWRGEGHAGRPALLHGPTLFDGGDGAKAP